MNSTNALEAYHTVGVHSGVEAANPHQLIAMLLDGALARIATAKGHMQRGEVGPRGECISRAISIVDGLQLSLNLDIEDEIVANLEALYDYIGRRLLLANAHRDEAILDEVTSLLEEIKSAWDAMPVEEREVTHDGA